ncbi:MAG TPA: hypothetical protein VGT08_19115 [Terracidiphilus sp.]|nr:hypothetical protein [Terracidiphilus sp.]
MKNADINAGLTRREMLQLSTAGVAALGAKLAFPELAAAAAREPGATATPVKTAEERLYSDLLQKWCYGLVARQVTGPADPALRGGLLCPACGLIHGRCGDAVYPLLRVAHSTGNERYLRAALEVHEWSERTVSRADGSWVNDVSLSSWQGITVFHAIALAEALEHHGAILDAAVRKRWTERLERAAKFLDGFITIETGNINYPVTASLAFVLCGRVLGDAHYVERGRGLAHEVLGQFTADGFLFGEGHPLRGVTTKGCRPVDLGYNVEESLPSLALYSLLADDVIVRDTVIGAMKTHMEFMLPDGAWDNSWGTRNYKWSWWGSRTSDGCHPGLVLMAEHEPRFREAAQRNAELMAACTHDGLLYGGPDYFAHGDPACIHHTFTHAKAVATVLDRCSFAADTGERPKLPRDEAYGLKSFPEIGTRLAAVGPWRATVTEYDWEYVEDVQAGSGGDSGGGHASGGALSQLYHCKLGPIFVASMTKYALIEMSNQQQYRGGTHMTLTPRIECAGKETYTSLDDLKAQVTAAQTGGEIVFDAKGRMLTTGHKSTPGEEVLYRLVYRLSEAGVELTASVNGVGPAPMRLIVPVIARADEAFVQPDARTVRIAKAKGMLTVTIDAAEGFEAVPKERTFNLVPGFEAIPLAAVLQAGKETRVRIVGTVRG